MQRRRTSSSARSAQKSSAHRPTGYQVRESRSSGGPETLEDVYKMIDAGSMASGRKGSRGSLHQARRIDVGANAFAIPAAQAANANGVAAMAGCPSIEPPTDRLWCEASRDPLYHWLCHDRGLSRAGASWAEEGIVLAGTAGGIVGIAGLAVAGVAAYEGVGYVSRKMKEVGRGRRQTATESSTSTTRTSRRGSHESLLHGYGTM